MRNQSPIGENPRLTVIEAQDALASTLGDLERIAWRFFSTARDLDVDLEDEEFPFAEPGPDHLRFFTALSCMGAYYGMLQLIQTVRESATRMQSDLVTEWQKSQELERRVANGGADPLGGSI